MVAAAASDAATDGDDAPHPVATSTSSTPISMRERRARDPLDDRTCASRASVFLIELAPPAGCARALSRRPNRADPHAYDAPEEPPSST